MRYIVSLFLLIFPIIVEAQKPQLPAQPATGLGGADYEFEEVEMHDFAEEPDGYWLFTPVTPKAKTAQLIVFLHGYGGYNPMIYGKWIKHLVKQGNIVLYPRYQQNLAKPKPNQFAPNVAQAIRDGLKELRKRKYPKIDRKAPLIIVGHSYGGVIASDLAINYEAYKIPKIAAYMMCSPGTAWMEEGRLESYAAMPTDVKIIIVVSEDDRVTGDEFGLKVFTEATNVEQITMLRQYADNHGKPQLKAGHNLTYSVDKDFDTGVRNYTAVKSVVVSTLDPMDYNGYWKLFDALINCTRSQENCDICFGDSPEKTNLGTWSDGTPIKPLEEVSRSVE